jgi:bisphosphoglycerate-dependent phosphoglycerate mutase
VGKQNNGLSKQMVKQRHGEKQFMAWRRGYNVKPPPEPRCATVEVVVLAKVWQVLSSEAMVVKMLAGN